MATRPMIIYVDFKARRVLRRVRVYPILNEYALAP